jgi:hypothetical protein
MRVVHAIVGAPGIANAKVTDMVPEDRRIAGLIDGPTRQGLYGGLVLGVFEMAVFFVGNLILPATAHGWASSQPVGLGLLALYAAAFVLIGHAGSSGPGRNGREHAPEPWPGSSWRRCSWSRSPSCSTCSTRR